MKNSIAILALTMCMFFGLGGSIQLSDNQSFNQSPFTIELVETAYAEETAPVVPSLPGAAVDKVAIELPTTDFLQKLMETVGGLKGLGTLGLVAVIIQLLMMFFRTPLAKFAGKWKMVIIWTLSLAGGLLTLRANGVDWGAALIHANTLAFAQGWINQMWKQFVVKGTE